MTLVEQPWTASEPRHDVSPHMHSQPWQATRQGGSHRNVSEGERMVSVAAGSILALLGASRRDSTGLLIAGLGGGLIYRGATGHCPMYQTLGVDSRQGPARLDGRSSGGIHIDQSFLIDKSPQELYARWRKLEDLPQIMSHLKSVEVLDDRRSRWVAKAPAIAGGEVSWEAETTADEPNTRISWRSLPGADVENRGSVRFVRAPGDRGTAVRVTLDYLPPGGQVGRWIAKLFGEDAEQQIREDLRKFKRVMETGEVATTEGQPHGTCMA